MGSTREIESGINPQLDGMRFFAVLLVLLHHVSNSISADFLIMPFMLTGWNGVFLFFVLSGYLLSLRLWKEVQKTGNFSAINFWGRRIFRTWPIYFVALAFYAWKYQPNFSKIVPYLFFVQNYVDRSFWMSTWSIAAQEQFYLALPILFFLILKIANKNQIVNHVLLGLLFILSSSAFFVQDSNNMVGAYAPMLLGVWIAYLDVNKNPFLNFLRRGPNLLFVLGLAIIYFPFAIAPESPLHYLSATIGFACIIML